MTRWIVGSLLVHLLLAVAIFATPLRDVIFRLAERRTDIAVSGDELEGIVATIRASNALKLARLTGEARAAADRLGALRDRHLAALATAGGDPGTVRVRPPAQDLHGLGIVAIYAAARAVESEAALSYQEMRAAIIAKSQQVPMAEAAATARVAVAPRPELDEATLTRAVRDPRDGSLDAFKEQIRRAGNETQAILDAVGNLCRMAERLDEAERQGISMELAQANSDDKSAYNGPELLPTELVPSPQSYSLGDFKPLPGRRLVGEAGEASTWMYVDTWWIMGPFGNQGRRLLNARFMPEVAVDLDAVATGKGGRELRWEWKRSNTLKIEPRVTERYSIYYAFTELWSDRDRDVWISTGSDDYGKLWLNDELVWVSPEEPKPFNAAEATRVVHLRPGVNKVLLRCENAGGTMGFCLLVCTK